MASCAAAGGGFRWAGVIDFYGNSATRRSPALAAEAERVYLTGFFDSALIGARAEAIRDATLTFRAGSRPLLGR